MISNIKDFPDYVIYDTGKVISRNGHEKTKRIIRGYYYVDLNYKGTRRNLRLGRLVAQCFLDNPKGLPQVNHIDGNCLNDHVSNLEWVTVSENQQKKNILRKEKGI